VGGWWGADAGLQLGVSRVARRLLWLVSCGSSGLCCTHHHTHARGAAAACHHRCCVLPSAPSLPRSYNGADWPNAFPACAGPKQSPVYLPGAGAGKEALQRPAARSTFSYGTLRDGNITNNGHTLQVSLPPELESEVKVPVCGDRGAAKATSIISGEGKVSYVRATPAQLHFHGRSEHVNSGVRARGARLGVRLACVMCTELLAATAVATANNTRASRTPSRMPRSQLAVCAFTAAASVWLARRPALPPLAAGGPMHTTPRPPHHAHHTTPTTPRPPHHAQTHTRRRVPA
jgi:hypothetical protein